MSTLEFKTRILPGGRIEAPSLEGLEGREATIRVVVEDEPPPLKKSFLENLGDYQGGQLYKNVEEVDRYIKEERDSWGD